LFNPWASGIEEQQGGKGEAKEAHYADGNPSYRGHLALMIPWIPSIG
jgi:hypothetical protein